MFEVPVDKLLAVVGELEVRRRMQDELIMGQQARIAELEAELARRPEAAERGKDAAA